MASAIDRVSITERGATRDTRPRSRSQAWKNDERTVSRWFQENDGINSLFRRISTSSGRLGHLTHLQFDSASKSYAIEVKRRESAPAWLSGAWSQVNQVAAEQRLRPVLVIVLPEQTYIVDGKNKRVPAMHIITPERHAHLLACEKRCEELDNGPSTADQGESL